MPDTARPRTPLRRVGAVMALAEDEPAARIWINGVTEAEGVWVPLACLPATLHEDGATFDVYLDDGQPIETGAFAQQLNPRTWEPWTDEEVFLGKR